MGAVGVALYYLASGNILLALAAGTCTQGDAGRLWGGLISLILYALGCLFLQQTSQARVALIFLSMTAPVLIWEAVFSGHFLLAFWWQGRSACDVLEGTFNQSLDGDEAPLTILWAFLTAMASYGPIILFRLARMEAADDGA